MKRTALASLVVFFALASGCANDGAEPTTDLDSAREGWLATGQALEKAGVHGVLSFDAHVDENGASAMVSGSVDCPDGGSLSLDAGAEASESAAAAEYEITFASCAVDGVVIDGDLSFAAHASETEAEVSMSGDLHFSGAAQGECALDLNVRTSFDGQASASVDVGGSMCGWGWDELS